MFVDLFSGKKSMLFQLHLDFSLKACLQSENTLADNEGSVQHDFFFLPLKTNIRAYP